MKSAGHSLVPLLLAASPLAFAAPSWTEEPSSQSPIALAAAAAPVRSHPLRGVVTKVQPETSTLMVKHEAIPGVMRAMTMLFKVEADVVKRVKEGDAITARMSRMNDEWRLDDVRVVPAESK